MTSDELSIKLCSRIEFMILQYFPRPTCSTKQRAHSELVAEVKQKIAERIGGNGLNIEIKV